ncbi:MAG: purine-binding chemotaxis protein CheW [Desulfobacteraceae bacterium Eth-SRB1]|nr:MAG: purine-binding chemotaxis protein CheW [Desulfobacteraceae bacterium Eth-SRB1]
MLEDRTAGKEIQVVIFRLGREEFGVRIDQVKEIIEMTHITRMPKAPSFIEGVINLRGQVIAVIDLAKQFDLPASEHDEETRIVVVDVDDNTVGMLVDSVPEVLRISAEDIDPTPSLIENRIDTRYIEGIGKLEDRLFVLLKLGKVLSPEEVERMEETVGD